MFISFIYIGFAGWKVDPNLPIKETVCYILYVAYSMHNQYKAKQSVNMTDSKDFHIFVCIWFLSPNGILYTENNYCGMVSHGILIPIQYIWKYHIIWILFICIILYNNLDIIWYNLFLQYRIRATYPLEGILSTLMTLFTKRFWNAIPVVWIFVSNHVFTFDNFCTKVACEALFMQCLALSWSNSGTFSGPKFEKKMQNECSMDHGLNHEMHQSRLSPIFRWPFSWKITHSSVFSPHLKQVIPLSCIFWWL